MTNTFQTGDPDQALRRLLATVFAPMITSGGLPTFQASTLTTDAFATEGFALNTAGDELVYTNQLSVAVGPFNQGDGTYWLGLHRDIHTDIAPWVRQTSTHYAWQRTGSGVLTSPPVPVDGLTTFAACTVLGGEIIEAVRVSPRATSMQGLGLFPADIDDTVIMVEGGGRIEWPGIRNGATPDGVARRARIETEGDSFVISADGGGGAGQASNSLRLNALVSVVLERQGVAFLTVSGLEGGILILHNLPTTAPATSGAIWRDPADGNRLKGVP